MCMRKIGLVITRASQIPEKQKKTKEKRTRVFAAEKELKNKKQKQKQKKKKHIWNEIYPECRAEVCFEKRARRPQKTIWRRKVK